MVDCPDISMPNAVILMKEAVIPTKEAVIPTKEGSARQWYKWPAVIPPLGRFLLRRKDSQDEHRIYTSSFKNFHSGLIELINASFLLLLHPFISFSRAIAFVTQS